MTATPIILPTAYFPPVPYIRALINAPGILIEHYETYPKQTFRNRCEILAASGRHKLIVPVSRPNGNHTLTKDTRVNYRENWRQNHWRALTASYNSSPYFDYYREKLEEFYQMKFGLLVELNRFALGIVFDMIGLKPPVGNTTSYMKQSGGLNDLRKSFSQKSMDDFPSEQEYPQVFRHKYGFVPNLSILDLIFNTGPETKERLMLR